MATSILRNGRDHSVYIAFRLYGWNGATDAEVATEYAIDQNVIELARRRLVKAGYIIPMRCKRDRRWVWRVDTDVDLVLHDRRLNHGGGELVLI